MKNMHSFCRWESFYAPQIPHSAGMYGSSVSMSGSYRVGPICFLARWHSLNQAFGFVLSVSLCVCVNIVFINIMFMCVNSFTVVVKFLCCLF